MKKFLSLCLILAIALSLVACGSKQVNDTPVGTGGSQQDVNTVTQPESGTQNAMAGTDDTRAEVNQAPVDDSYGGSDADPGFMPNADDDGGTDVDKPDKGPKPLSKDSMADEKYIAEEFFGVKDLSGSDIEARIGSEIAEFIGPSATADIGIFLNMYSIEGFHRYLEYGEEEYEAARKAAVVTCWMLGVNYDELWANGYMSQEDAQPIIDVVTAHSQG